MRRRMLLCLLAAALLLFCACAKTEDEKNILMTIDGAEVAKAEGLLYAWLTMEAFETYGGEEIHAMTLNGRDADSVALESALESLIRTKVMASEYEESLSETDELFIDNTVQSLKEEIGEERLDVWGITEGMLRGYTEESYRAYCYTASMNFLPGDMESELDAEVAEAYISYDGYDQDTYLQKVSMQWIMIYTGTWVDGEFVSYPSEQQDEKLELIQEAYEAVADGRNFELVRAQYSEEENSEDCPLLTYGIIQCGEDGVFYRGQMPEDAANEIFSTPAGSYSDIIETDYGYMLVWVESFEEPASSDYARYENQLEEARESYRAELEEQLAEVLLEEEYERLLEDVQVDINDDVWEAICTEVQ